MSSFLKALFSASFIATSLLFAGCAPQQEETQSSREETDPASSYSRAVAVIHPTQDNSVNGTVFFEQTGEGVTVTADISGLQPGLHGFHIHQYGDCSAADATSAGGHYNPAGNDHGSPTQDNRHAGDMGNLAVDEEGNATLEYTDPVITLNGPNSVIGRGVIIHGGEDDLESQPSGAAGARIGCGVIGIANASM